MNYCVLVFGVGLSERGFRRGFPVPVRPITSGEARENRRRIIGNHARINDDTFGRDMVYLPCAYCQILNLTGTCWRSWRPRRVGPPRIWVDAPVYFINPRCSQGYERGKCYSFFIFSRHQYANHMFLFYFFLIFCHNYVLCMYLISFTFVI